jgi:hypothetical protein
MKTTAIADSIGIELPKPRTVLTFSSAARIALYLAKITDNVSTLADHLVSHNLGSKFLEKALEILMLLSTFSSSVLDGFLVAVQRELQF